jgi:hypothetical protein
MAISDLLKDPITAGIGTIINGAIAGGGALWNKISSANRQRKIGSLQERLGALLKQRNSIDPTVQAEIARSQQQLRDLGVNVAPFQPNTTGQPNLTAGPLPQGQPTNEQMVGTAPGQNQPGQQIQGGIPETSFWSGRQAYNEQIPLYTPNTELWREGVVNELRNNPAQFGPIRQEEIRRFNQETVPNLAEKYFGANAGTQFSGKYPEALGRGGANLGRQLAADEQRFNAERESRLMNVANQPSFATVRHPRESGAGEQLLQQLIGSAGGAATQYGGEWLQNAFNKPNQSQVINAPQQGQQSQPQQVDQNVYQKPQLSQLSPEFQSNHPGFLGNILKGQEQARNSLLGGRTR